MNRVAYCFIRNASTSAGPVATIITQKLTSDFIPLHLQVDCESHLHNVVKGSEKHFHVLIVSDKFKDVPVIQRHRMVHECLKDELRDYVHALRVTARAPHQWHQSNRTPKSPPCLGKILKLDISNT